MTIFGWSGSPTHLLQTSRYMSVGEPDYIWRAHIWYIWARICARQIWSFLARSPHCNYNVKLQLSLGRGGNKKNGLPNLQDNYMQTSALTFFGKWASFGHVQTRSVSLKCLAHQTFAESKFLHKKVS